MAAVLRDGSLNVLPALNSDNMMKRIIIDCDPGNGIPGANTDDGLALALALASPELQTEMITTVSGNTPAETGAGVVRDLLARCGAEIPVYRGAGQALSEPPAAWRQHLDNSVQRLSLAYLWDKVPQPAAFAADKAEAVERIGELICAAPGEITLLVLGPLTNVALAMQRYPQMAESVAEIIVMGGVFCLDDYLKDTNFGLDPEAASQVMNSGAKVTLVPMDVTVNTLLTLPDLARITAAPGPLNAFVHDTLAPWIDYSVLTRGIGGSWIHDALVVAWLLEPQVATAEWFRAGIELHPGITRGKSWRYRPPLRVAVGIDADAGAKVQILTSVDNQRLLNLLERTLSPDGGKPVQPHG